MATARVLARYGLAALLAAVVAGTAVAAEDDAKLREQVLKLNDLTGDDPIEGQIKHLLEEPAAAKKLLGEAVKLAKSKDRPLNFNSAYVLARVAQELKEVEPCEVLYRYASDEAMKLQSSQKLVQSFGNLIDFYFGQKQYDKCAKLCGEFLEIKGNATVELLKDDVMQRLVQSMALQGKLDDALKLAQIRVDKEEEEKGWRALQLKGWVLREADRLKEAAKAYETVIERIEGDKALKPDMRARFVERNRYQLSHVYVDLKQIDKAAEHLKALLAKKPDDPTYNNDLGYIWADHDMHLEEAEKLIQKALDADRKRRKAEKVPPEEDKDSAAYLDSMGWVLYKQKKYKEAKKYLEEAIKDKEEGQHIELYDHLGDIHLALGEKAEAVAAWKKGLEVAGSTKREKQKKEVVEKKVKDNQ
jgi:tetratricopeptide (TPR) repeat protein